MNRMWIPLSAFVMMLWALPSAASTYHSYLGYSINLPAGWQVINRQQVSSNPKMLEAVFSSADQGSLKGANKDFMASVRHLVSSGGVEYYFNKTYPGEILAVNEINGQIPQTPTQLRESCQAAPGELSRYAGKPMQVYQCKAVSFGNVKALYVVSDAFAKGDSTIEYQIQKTPDKVLVFTVTCQNQNRNATEKSFYDMMKTVHIE